jgi:hypothetical protein
MTKIVDHNYRIQEAFNQCFYIVPDYQREYVWTDKEVLKLLEDIDEQVGSDKEYFVGTILVSPTAQQNHFDVIDGQQRLTTFFLLLCALRHKFRGEEQHSAFDTLLATKYIDREGNLRKNLKLEPRYENAGELVKYIVDLDNDPQAVRSKIQAAGIPKFGSLENLLDAYGTIHRYVTDNYDTPQKLRQYWGYLANNVVFIQIQTDVSSALKIFETINERGVGLDSMDLLKNLLFTSVDQKQFTELRNEWKKITAPIEKAREKPLRFLRYFLMANYVVKNDRRDAVVRADEIYDWLTNKENASLCDYKNKPFEFVRKITRNVELFIGFTSGFGNDGKPNLAMDSMQQLCGAAFSLHFVLLLAAANLPKALFDHFVTQLESFLFYYIFTKTPTKDLERSFSIWADELREICEIGELRLQHSRLDAFVMEKFQSNMSSKSDELADAMKRYSLRSMQQYRTRYLLAKLTQWVDMAFRGMRTPGSLKEYSVLEIEHILPNTPEDDLRASFAQASPGTDYEDYKTKLGNLTLLEKPINIVASNGFFASKKAEYAKCANYLTRSIAELSLVGKNSSINRVSAKLSSFDRWTAKEIDERQNMLIALANDVWKTSPIEAA